MTSFHTIRSEMNYNEEQEKEIQDIVFRLVYDLSSHETKEAAMFELSKLRELYPMSLENIIAPTLWYSFGSIALLLQEVVSIYPYLNTPELKQSQASRVCNALTSLQHVASHRDTRKVFLRGTIFYMALKQSFYLLIFSSYTSISLSLPSYN